MRTSSSAGACSSSTAVNRFGQLSKSWSRPFTSPQSACVIGWSASATVLRRPVAKRSRSLNAWFSRFARKRQMPARVGSSGQGSTPGESTARISTWQELLAEPTLTNRPPVRSSTTVFEAWSPVAGMPETIVVGSPTGSSWLGESR